MAWPDRERRNPPGRAAGFRDTTLERPAVFAAGRAKSTADPAQVLLARLDGVRSAGHGWVARCPAHDDKRPSLSVAEGREGRLLVHCFGGCQTADVLVAVGLELRDLYPGRINGTPLSLADRKAMTERSRLARWRAAWNSIAREVALVEVAARELAAGQVLDAAEVERIAEAAQRIAEARVAVAEVEQHGTARRLGPRPGRFFADLGADHLTPEIARTEASQ